MKRLAIILIIMASLGAVPAMADTVVLSWEAAVDAVVEGQTTSGVGSYRIYRQDGVCPNETTNIAGPPVGTVAADVLTYTDTFTVLSCWAVTAVDNAGNESAQSNKVSKDVVVTPPPVALFSLKAVGTPPATVGVEAIVSAPLQAGQSFAVYVNGAFEQTQGGFPYCWGTEPANPPRCEGVAHPPGVYVVEFRLMQGTVELERHSMTVTVAGPGPDVTPPSMGNTLTLQ